MALDAWQALKIRGIGASTLKSVMAALAKPHNEKTGQCNPGTAKIARAAGVCPGSVSEILQRARERRLIDYEPNPGGAGKSNQYELIFVDAWIELGRPDEYRLEQHGDAWRYVSETIGGAGSNGTGKLPAAAEKLSARGSKTSGASPKNYRPRRKESSESLNLKNPPAGAAAGFSKKLIEDEEDEDGTRRKVISWKNLEPLARKHSITKRGDETRDQVTARIIEAEFGRGASKRIQLAKRDRRSNEGKPEAFSPPRVDAISMSEHLSRIQERPDDVPAAETDSDATSSAPPEQIVEEVCKAMTRFNTDDVSRIAACLGHRYSDEQIAAAMQRRLETGT